MTLLSHVARRWWLVAAAGLVLSLSPRAAHAWAIGSQINETGCHEPITAEALRLARMTLKTAPVVTPTRDEAALIDDVLFSPPADFIHDLAGMTLLLGVRDNDLKGIDPLSSLDLIQVHGNPKTQMEHCIRSGSDDGAAGDLSALAACATFIQDTATEALDGLDANGNVDITHRVPFAVYVTLAGQVSPQLPLFYIKIGAAMHALEDGFPHTYRTADGTRVTTVLNWIDLVGTQYDEARDGPPHRAELDHCWHDDPTINRNYVLATRAATALLTVALDPSLTRAQKIAQFQVVTATYLGYDAGCTFDNHWCAPAEAAVTDTNVVGCDAGGGAGGWGSLVFASAVLMMLRRAKPARVAGALAMIAAGAFAVPAYADGPPVEDKPAAVPVVDPAPAVALTPADGQEPKRDLKTPTVTEVQEVRKAKQLGNAFGFTASVGGSVDRTAAVGTVGMRYRLNEKWLVGLDVGWNPWITTAPVKMRGGVAEAYATVVRRFPMSFDRVNLRSSLHLGTSTLLFDVYGASKYSTGPYLGVSVLGIDYDFGGSLRLVIDPAEFAIPVPELGQLPLWYEQFRFMIGIQYGA